MAETKLVLLISILALAHEKLRYSVECASCPGRRWSDIHHVFAFGLIVLISPSHSHHAVHNLFEKTPATGLNLPCLWFCLHVANSDGEQEALQ